MEEVFSQLLLLTTANEEPPNEQLQIGSARSLLEQ